MHQGDVADTVNSICEGDRLTVCDMHGDSSEK